MKREFTGSLDCRDHWLIAKISFRYGWIQRLKQWDRDSLLISWSFPLCWLHFWQAFLIWWPTKAHSKYNPVSHHIMVEKEHLFSRISSKHPRTLTGLPWVPCPSLSQSPWPEMSYARVQADLSHLLIPGAQGWGAGAGGWEGRVSPIISRNQVGRGNSLRKPGVKFLEEGGRGAR